MYEIILATIVFIIALVLAQLLSKSLTPFTTLDDIVSDYEQLVVPPRLYPMSTGDRLSIQQIDKDEKSYNRQVSCQRFNSPRKIGQKRANKMVKHQTVRIRRNC